MRIGVAVPIGVVDLVDGNAVDGELDRLALLGVEPAQEDLIGVAGSPLVGDEDPRRQLQDVRRLLVGDDRQLPDLDLGIGGATVWLLLSAAPYVHVNRRRFSRFRRRRGSDFRKRGQAGGRGGQGGRHRPGRRGGRRGAAGVAVGATTGGGSKWNKSWTRLATGTPSRVAGRNRHRVAASNAARSSAGAIPCTSSTPLTSPAGLTVAVTETSPVGRVASASAGYAGRFSSTTTGGCSRGGDAGASARAAAVAPTFSANARTMGQIVRN